MLHHLPIPLLSSNAGVNNDGVFIGSVNESPLVARYTSLNFCPTVKVYRLDKTGNSLNILEETSLAVSSTPSSWNPFDNDLIPTNATLKVYDSTDGVWATNPLNLSVGSVADLKTTGYKKFVFGENAARTAWKPSADPGTNIPSRKYIRVELNDGGDNDSFIISCDTYDIQGFIFRVDQAGSASQTVKVSSLQLIRKDSDVRYQNETAFANGSLTSAYTPTSNTYFPVLNRTEEIIVSDKQLALVEYVFRAKGANVESTTAEYFSSGTWKTLSYASASNFETSGPAVTTNTPTRYSSSYALPSDATSDAHTYQLETGTETVTGYGIRFRTSSVSSEGPINTPIVADRIKEFGTANTGGMTPLTDTTIKGVCVRGIGTFSGNATVVQLINLTTGDNRTFTIPTNPTFPFTATFTTPITIPSGNKMGMAWVSGAGISTNLDLYLND